MLQQLVAAAAVPAGNGIDAVKCFLIFVHLCIGHGNNPVDIIDVLPPLAADGGLAVRVIFKFFLQITYLILEDLLGDSGTDDDKFISADPIEICLCKRGPDPFGTLDQNAVS